MLPDMLNISILFGAGVPDPDFLKVLEDIPQVQMLAQVQHPEEVSFRFHPEQGTHHHH
jgi:hypothetical protein